VGENKTPIAGLLDGEAELKKNKSMKEKIKKN